MDTRKPLWVTYTNRPGEYYRLNEETGKYRKVISAGMLPVNPPVPLIYDRATNYQDEIINTDISSTSTQTPRWLDRPAPIKVLTYTATGRLAASYRLPAWLLRYKCPALCGLGMPFTALPDGDSFRVLLATPEDNWGLRLMVEDLTRAHN